MCALYRVVGVGRGGGGVHSTGLCVIFSSCLCGAGDDAGAVQVRYTDLAHMLPDLLDHWMLVHCSHSFLYRCD